MIVVAAIWLWWLNDSTIQNLSPPILNDTNFWSLGFESIPVTVPILEYSIFSGDILRYFTPKFFDHFIKVVWETYPTILVLIVVFLYTLRKVRLKLLKTTMKKSVAIRDKIEKVRNSSTDFINKEKKITNTE